MSNTFSLNRLKLALREFWEMNKTVIYCIPAIMLIAVLLFHLWPGSFLYKEIFQPYKLNNISIISEELIGARLGFRYMILLLIPIFIFICSNTYLNKLNKSIRTTLVPFTKIERIVTLWLFSTLIVVISCASFLLFDGALFHYVKINYLADVTNFLESNGKLYYQFDPYSYFGKTDNHMFTAIFIMFIFCLPIYHLASVFFKRLSLLWFSILLTIIIVITILINVNYLNAYQSSIIQINIDNTATNLIIIAFVLSIIGLLITSFYFKLKEKEI